MALQFFSIPVRYPDDATQALNGFLRQHHVLSVDRHLIADGANSVWTVCVEYHPGRSSGPHSAGTVSSKSKVDYREVLNAEDFAVFAQLRQLRKELAAVEAVPIYKVFTNEQLAQIAQQRVDSRAALLRISGIGDARADKYGAAVLSLLAQLGRIDSDEASRAFA